MTDSQSKELDELRKRIAALHALISQATTHLGHRVHELGDELIALDLHFQAMQAPPVTSDPTDPAADPAALGLPSIEELAALAELWGVGSRVPLAELVDWTFKPVAGGGRPDGVEAFDPGATMRGFRFRPHVDAEGKLDSNNGILRGVHPVYRARVEDAVVDGWRPWGGNGKGLAELTIEHVTARGRLHTGQHSEHAFYLGRQGWSPKVRELMAAQDGPAAPLVEAAFAGQVAGQVAGDVVLEEPSLAVLRCLVAQSPGAAVQITQRDRNSYGQVECPLDPEGFDANAGPDWIHELRAIECGVQHPAAVVSLFAPEHLTSGRAMRRASAGAYVTYCEVANLVEKPIATLLLVAGRQFLYVEGGAWRRADMGSSHRPLWSLGDRYAHGGQVPVVVGGGPCIVRDVTFWSEQPTHVDVLLEAPSSRLEWRGCKLEDGSAPVELRVNGAALGRVDLVEVSQ